MNYLKFIITAVSLTVIFTVSCSTAPANINRIEYKIPGHIIINSDDLKNSMGDVQTDPLSPLFLTITLYSYSAGAETISFSGTEDVKTENSSGMLKAIVKITDGKKIQQAEFLTGKGNTKDEMILSLAKEIKRKFFKL